MRVLTGVVALLGALGWWAGLSPARGSAAQEDPAGMEAFQREIVRRLAGAAEILPGRTVQNRGSAENREAVREYLERTMASLGLDVQHQMYRENGENLFALLPATEESGEYLVLGAHFDTVERSPGASDNATGCALVLGVARYLVSLPRRSRNVFIVFFDEEERGLQGSRAFAQSLVDEGRNVIAVHTVDQMGWDADGDGAFELELPYEGAESLYRVAAETIGFRGPIHLTEESGSDHSAFRRLGFKAVGLTEEYRNGDTTPHIHRSTDTWDTVDFDYLASVTRLVEKVFGTLTDGSGKDRAT